MSEQSSSGLDAGHAGPQPTFELQRGDNEGVWLLLWALGKCEWDRLSHRREEEKAWTQPEETLGSPDLGNASYSPFVLVLALCGDDRIASEKVTCAFR